MQEEKKPIYKISPSLINSYINMKNSKYDNSHISFINALNRVPSPKTYGMKRGDAFEKAIIEGKETTFYNKVKGCYTQYYLEKELPVKDYIIRITGRADFVNKDLNIIYDSKRVGDFEENKFDDSFQHDFYFYCLPTAMTFFYLVGSGTKWYPDEYYEIRFDRDEGIDQRVLEIVNEFITYLEENNLFEIFKKNFKAVELTENKKKELKEKQEKGVVI